MRTVYDRLFAMRAGWENGDLFDMVSPDADGEGLSLPQLLWPSRYEPYFCDTVFRRNAFAMARQLLGPAVVNMNEHAILKVAFKGAATPWHQDESFNTQGSGFRESISMWMPLQDVAEENGCLWYIPKSNLGPLYPHRSPHNDPKVHGLETTPPDVSLAVPIHDARRCRGHSPFYDSAFRRHEYRPRAAPRYTLGFGVKSGRNLLARDYPWNIEKQTAREARQLQSMRPHQRFAYQLKKWLHGHTPWK